MFYKGKFVVGARRVIVATQHCDREGNPKIRTRCDYPLTGQHVVSVIVTELAVIQTTPEGLLLKEVAPGVTVAGDGLTAMLVTV